MEAEDSMLCLQEPALCPLLCQIYLVLVRPCSYFKFYISTTIPSTQKTPSDIPTKNVHALRFSPMHAK
jgi:hypothetical protein